MTKSYLFIHNLSESGPMLGLFNNRGLIDEVGDRQSVFQSRTILNLLDKLLHKNKIKPKDLKGIVVVNGPGSFSSIRLGLATGNTLSYLLKIPVVGASLDEFNDVDDLIKVGQKKLLKLLKTKKLQPAMPFYGREPNITKSKI